MLVTAITPMFAASENVRQASTTVPATPLVWEGWGTSLCWMGKALGERDDIADLLFTTKPVTLPEFPGQTLPGLGLTIVRYNAGASSTRPVGDLRMEVPPKTFPHRQIDALWLDPAQRDPVSPGWDWNADAAQRAMLLKARDRGANHFELFSNSPPWWMLTNRNPSGAPGNGVNLDPAHHADFAYYLATIARRARDHWGLAFTTVSPFNEPSSGYWKGDGKQEGSNLPPSLQAKLLPMLRTELDRQGLRELPIAASDETSYKQALDTWKQLPPEARAVVAQVNVHGYQHRKGPRAELAAAVAADKTRLWNSEYGDSKADGLELAHNLHLDFQLLRPSAWCYWQPLDTSLGWSFIQFDAADRRLLAVTPKLYVMAHYSRHLRPGMELLDSSDPSIIAALDRTAGLLVVVALNEGPARELRLDIAALGASPGRVRRWLTEPRRETRYHLLPALELERGSLVCPLPPDSIQTFEISAIVPAKK